MERKCNILDILDYNKMKIDENENLNSNDYFKVAIGPKYAKKVKKIQKLWKMDNEGSS